MILFWEILPWSQGVLALECPLKTGLLYRTHFQLWAIIPLIISSEYLPTVILIIPFYSSTYQAAFDISFPEKIVKTKRKYMKRQPWITNGILNSSNQKAKLYTKKLKTPNATNILKYKLYCKIYNRTGVDTNFYGHLPCRADRYKIHLPSPRCHLPPIYTQNITFSSYFYLINRISVYRHPVQSAFYTAPSRRYTQLRLPCLQCPGIVLTTKPQTSYTASQLHKHS